MPVQLTLTPTPSNTPTVSITASRTPTITPTSTPCPGICFSGVGTNAFGVVNNILQDNQDGEKVMIAGTFTSYNGVSNNTMVRSFTDGEIDTTFSAGTGFGVAGISQFVQEVSQQNDGKYICTGNFTNYRGVNRNRIARINYDGTLDTSFVVGTGYSKTTLYSLIQSDGKILVCSQGINSYSGTPVGMLSRLNTDGTLDTTFSNNALSGLSTELITKVYRNADGTMYVSGRLSVSGRNGIIKLNSDGTYASSDPFNTSGVGLGVAERISDFQVQSDGKIIVIGDFQTYNGVNNPRSIRRINADGSNDSTFNGAGIGANSGFYEVELQGSKYLVVGTSTSFNLNPINQVIRLNNNGSLDTSWNNANFTSLTTEDNIQHLTILTGNTNDSGYIFCGGFFNSYDGILTSNILKMDSNGYMQDCDIVNVTPTVTSTPTRTPTQTQTQVISPTPTITQTATPTKSPIVSYLYAGGASQWSTSTLACTNKTCARSYYKPAPSWAIGTVVYDDSLLTTPTNGNNLWIAVDTSSTFCGGTGWAAVQVDTNGVILDFISCP